MLCGLEQEDVNKLFYCKVASVKSIDAKMNHEKLRILPDDQSNNNEGRNER